MITPTCQVCGTTGEFNSKEEAYKAGWDILDDFGIVTCSKCPSAPLLFNK